MKKIFIVAAALTQFVANGMVPSARFSKLGMDADKILDVIDAKGILNIPNSTLTIKDRTYVRTSEERASNGRESVLGVNFGVNPRITYIGQYVFSNCSALKSMCIPSSVLMLGHGCFYGCRSLESVVFEENSHLTDIEERVFESCSALKSIHIPSGVTSLGEYCFYGCTSLESIVFEENSQLSYIDYSAFYYCSGLKIIEFGLAPARADYFAAADLSTCNSELDSMDVPEGVARFYSSYFSHTSLSSIFVPSGIKIFDNGRYGGGKGR